MLSEVLENFKLRNIYNDNEMGIYYMTFATKKLSGSKKAKDLIIALVAVNMDDSDKCPLLIIGKSRNPRCLRGIQQLLKLLTPTTHLCG